jgi:hypothetical protein
MSGGCEFGKANRMLIEDFKRSVKDLWVKIDELTKAINSRPSWLVCMVISGLFGAVVSLSTFIICNSHKLLIDNDHLIRKESVQYSQGGGYERMRADLPTGKSTS